MAEVTLKEMFDQTGPLYLHGDFSRRVTVKYNRITYGGFKSRMQKLMGRSNIQVRQIGLQPTMWNDCYFIREKGSGATLVFVPVFSPFEPRSITMLYMDLVSFKMDKQGNIQDVRVVTKTVAQREEIRVFFQGVVQYIFEKKGV